MTWTECKRYQQIKLKGYFNRSMTKKVSQETLDSWKYMPGQLRPDVWADTQNNIVWMKA